MTSAPTTTHRYVTIETDRRLTLHVAETGPEDAPLVVMLHGFPDSWTTFARQAAALADRYRVVMPDQRGFNLSDKPRSVSAYAMPHLVADVAALIQSYGRGPAAAVVGHDWGAAVAWSLGALRPELTRRIAAVNVPHPAVFANFLRKDAGQRRRSRYMLFFQLPLIAEAALARNDYAGLVEMLRRAGGPNTFTQDEIDQAKKSWSHPRALTSMLAWYRAAARSVLMGAAIEAQVPVPVQIIWGTGDPALKHQMAQACTPYCGAGVQIHLMEGARHWPHVERPDEFNAVLRAFLEG